MIDSLEQMRISFNRIKFLYKKSKLHN
jgi:hypothetical protein